MAQNDLSAADRQAELEKIEKEYMGIKRMMLTGLIAVLALAGVLIFTRPEGYLILVPILLVVEGVSYPLLSKSLDKRRQQRIDDLDSEAS